MVFFFSAASVDVKDYPDESLAGPRRDSVLYIQEQVMAWVV
jgi:hypothetical protein